MVVKYFVQDAKELATLARSLFTQEDAVRRQAEADSRTWEAIRVTGLLQTWLTNQGVDADFIVGPNLPLGDGTSLSAEAYADNKMVYGQFRRPCSVCHSETVAAIDNLIQLGEALIRPKFCYYCAHHEPKLDLVNALRGLLDAMRHHGLLDDAKND